MKALILNTHSTLNSGDLAIVLAQAQYLNERFPGIRLSLTSRTPEVDRAVYQPRGIAVIPAIFPAPSVFAARAEKFYRSFQNLLDFGSKSRLKQEMRDSDIVISSGGGYFYTSRRIGPGPMFLQNLAHVKLAYKFKKPVVFFPQSFGPIYNSLSQQILSKLLNNEQALRIYTREDISRDYLERLLKVDPAKIVLCPDMAFYLSQEEPSGIDKVSLDLPGPVVALTLRSWDFPESTSTREKEKKSEDYLQCLEEVCGRIYEKWSTSFCLFPQVRGPGRFEDDRDITLKFWGRLQKIIPEENRRLFDPDHILSPFWLMDLLAQTDLVFATRFHSAILAMIAGTPAIAINYQPKSLGMMRMLDLERFSIDIDHMDADNLFSMAEDALVHTDEVKQEIGREVEKGRDRIRQELDREFKNNFAN